MIYPEEQKKINAVDKQSKYIVKVMSPTDLSESLFDYAECFYEAAHTITEYVLDTDQPDIGMLDTYFFPIAFLYRHCIELGLKAIGFQYIPNKEEQENFVKKTKHNLAAILAEVMQKCSCPRQEELQWLQKYFGDISKKDRESDSFRYPFHIDHNSREGKYVIYAVFNEQTHIDLKKFAEKFEAAYEIIQKWYRKEEGGAAKWKQVVPSFIETGGYYYEQSVVGYQYNRAKFFPYTKAYLETANYLKRYMKQEIDEKKTDFSKNLFLPMCYLYRNCVELSLKTIWFEETKEDFQTKCKCMKKDKHSIWGMWGNIKPYVMQIADEENPVAYIDVIENYCDQVHKLDGDANKFRYPMSKKMQAYFTNDRNRSFDFMKTGDFFEALNNILACIDGQLNDMNDQKAEMEAEYYSEMASDMN